MGQIRTLAAEDLPEVANLFRKTFLRVPASQAGPRSDELVRYLKSVFMEHPWQDPDIVSRVHVSREKVTGFMGALPLRLQLDGAPLRAAVSCSLMVENPVEDPLAGARLIRAFVNGPQEISLSETSNGLAQRMWQQLGGVSAPMHSMFGWGVFGPGALARAAAARKRPALRLLRPLTPLVESISSRLAGSQWRPDERAEEAGCDASHQEMIDFLLEHSRQFTLRPDWEPESLDWFLSHASQKEHHGTLHRRIVRTPSGAPAGAYLYYGRPHDLAWVLQIIADPGHADRVVEDLFTCAYRRGSAAVRGRAEPWLMDTLLRRQCFFYNRFWTLLRSGRKDLLELIGSGNALVHGLAGESWVRLYGGVFD